MTFRLSQTIRADEARARILLTGAAGQVGWELRRALEPLGAITSFDRGALDFTDLAAVRAVVRDVEPTMIVNAAAYTRVDQAETETAIAHLVNDGAPRILAEEAARRGAIFVHYSTDAVFDGTATRGYTEDDRPAPISAYGRSKLAGEEGVLASGARAWIFRVTWVYGLRGHNFLRSIHRLSRERAELRVVADQRGAPTWSRAIAEATAGALQKIVAADEKGSEVPPTGIYHMTPPDVTTWHGFAEAIVAALPPPSGKPRPPVIPITTAEYPLVAPRGASSVLDSTRLMQVFGIGLAPWREELARCLASGPIES